MAAARMSNKLGSAALDGGSDVFAILLGLLSTLILIGCGSDAQSIQKSSKQVTSGAQFPFATNYCPETRQDCSPDVSAARRVAIQRVVAADHAVNGRVQGILRRPTDQASAAVMDKYLREVRDLLMAKNDVLPPALVGARRGRLALRLVVGDGGQIRQVFIEQSSGYSDIDAHAVDAMFEIGRVPPPEHLIVGGIFTALFSAAFPVASDPAKPADR
jgi:TonB family protein